MSEQSKIDAERAAFEAWVVSEWPTAPLHYVRDALPKTDPRYGEYCDESLQRAWVGWQARASLPVGVPDGWIAVTERMPEKGRPVQVWCDGSDSAGVAWRNDDAWYMPEPQAIGYESITHWQPLTAAPTVKAEQPDCVYCQGHGDVTRISGQTAESYSEHNEECPECKGTGLAPSLPAAGSTVEEVEVVAWRYGFSGGVVRDSALPDEWRRSGEYEPLMTVAQYKRIVAALSAQQSAPERVSVPVEQLKIATEILLDPRAYGVGLAMIHGKKLRAILSSHGRGEA